VDPPATRCRRYVPCSDTNYSKASEDYRLSHSRLKHCHPSPKNQPPKPAVLAPRGRPKA
jgi:hypothetical protein